MASAGANRCSFGRLAISKRISAFNSDGSFAAYIPRLQAIGEVRDFLADWTDESTKDSIHRRLRTDQGKLDQWQPRASGNICVDKKGHPTTVDEDGNWLPSTHRGPLVLQLT